MVQRNHKAGRLHFTTDLESAVTKLKWSISRLGLRKEMTVPRICLHFGASSLELLHLLTPTQLWSPKAPFLLAPIKEFTIAYLS